MPGYKAGGPIRSCYNLVLVLKNSYDVYVLTTDTDHGETTPYKNIETGKWLSSVLLPGAQIYYLEKKTVNRQKIKVAIQNCQADFVYLNMLFSPLLVMYPLWLKRMGLVTSKLIVAPRGSLYDSALAVKKYKKMPFLSLYKNMGIRKMATFHATNNREKSAIEKYFPGGKVVTANNLPNLYQPAFITVKKQTGSLKCIFISRIVPIKNLLFLLDILKEVKGNLGLTIVGPAEDEAYWKLCQDKIEELPKNIVVEYLGAQDNDKLFQLINVHHLFILPSAGENFGHAIFEAFLAGRPVLISDQTPWLQLKDKQVGWDLPLNNPSLFVQALHEAMSWPQMEFDKSAEAAWQFASAFISNPGLIKPYQQLFT